MKNANFSRRSFIVGTAAAAGGLAIGVRLPFGSGSAEAQSAAEAGAEVRPGSSSSRTTPA